MIIFIVEVYLHYKQTTIIATGAGTNDRNYA